ncbi:lasso peptide biosynthesis B2 protein [Streptomyces sp. JH002]|uniref:lasso peptide biosynthesis B2 protein n=1 Tax=Streptomyces sp. JH002 TaxID=2763259 RepID=UPI003D802D66
MSGSVVTETSPAPPFRHRIAARCAIGVALLLARLSPRRMRRAMEFLSRGARPADHAGALRARDAVVAVSVRCAGPWCLQRSIATALLCRARGRWPDWYTGVRTQPFRAHAWVAAEGRPVGEHDASLRLFLPIMSVRARR